MARTKRPSTTADLIRSLAVILIPLVLITIVFTNTPDDHPVKEVAWQPVLATARKQAPFPVLAPTNLPAGWRATRVTWVEQGDPYLNGQPSLRNLWQLGFLTPNDVFVDLNQADTQLPDLIDEQTRQGAADGESSIGDRTWQRMLSADGRTHSLVLREPKSTVIISADLPYSALEAYTSTLSTG